MPSSVARLRWIAFVVAVGLALVSILFGLISWHRWRHPELTAPARLFIGHWSVEQAAAMYRAGLAQERAWGISGLILSALGTAASAVLLIVFGRGGRNFVLSAAGRSAALAVSIPLTLCAVFAAGRVTLLNTIGLGIVVWWGVAGACSLFSLLLWRHRGQAANNRWRGP